jgi:aldehyde:ferredoxin oxidoreductase
MARCFNLKHGFSPEDDYLPERMYRPAKGGPQEGSFIPREVFSEGVRLYYEMNGWDRETSVPTQGKLIELGLGCLCSDMQKMHTESICHRDDA